MTLETTKEARLHAAWYDAVYRYKLSADFDTYLYFMHDQDVYYDVADQVKDAMTEEENLNYEYGEFPLWVHQEFNKYETELFGRTVNDAL
ncbi:hypothetical protein AAY80_060 [Stenotrophomonas phage vB_SmaS-DLP_6]|nr:hypothetical protein AAY80_060 [Stenotrophomonas phage vB_SmaS-DLP_6]